MTPEIHANFKTLKMISDMLIPALEVAKVFDLKRIEEEMRPWANGTLGIIAMQSMGIRDLQLSEKNLTHAIEVSKAIRHLSDLLIREGGTDASSL